MTLSLSTCWNGHRFDDGLALAKEIQSMGFEWLEISHGTPVTLMPGLLEAVGKRKVKVSSLHAPCPSPVEVRGDAPDVYEFTSDRPEQRRRAVSLTIATIEMAARFGTDRVVLHLGRAAMPDISHRLEKMALEGGLHSRGYVTAKLEAVRLREEASSRVMEKVGEALVELLPHCEKHGVRLGIETRSHYEQAPTMKEMGVLLERFAESRWIGSWHDFGHAQRQANLGFLDHAEYLGTHAHRLIGCHVHDVRWPEKDHQIPLSTGGVAFEQLLPMVPQGVPLVWELSPRQKRLDIVAAREMWEARLREWGFPQEHDLQLSSRSIGCSGR